MLAFPWAPPFDMYFATSSARHPFYMYFAPGSARHSLGSSFRQVFRYFKCSPSFLHVFCYWKCSPFPGLLLSTGNLLPIRKCSPFPGLLLLTGIYLLVVLAIPWAPPFDRYFATRSACLSLGSSFRQVFRYFKCSPYFLHVFCSWK